MTSVNSAGRALLIGFLVNPAPGRDDDRFAKDHGVQIKETPEHLTMSKTLLNKLSSPTPRRPAGRSSGSHAPRGSGRRAATATGLHRLPQGCYRRPLRRGVNSAAGFQRLAHRNLGEHQRTATLYCGQHHFSRDLPLWPLM